MISDWLKVAAVRSFWRATRPLAPDTRSALEHRWNELPDRVRTPAQLLGRRTPGCEGTHGVFPRCNLACTPCYHGRDANRVRTDGPHTLAEIDRQMAYLRDLRGTARPPRPRRVSVHRWRHGLRAPAGDTLRSPSPGSLPRTRGSSRSRSGGAPGWCGGRERFGC